MLHLVPVLHTPVLNTELPVMYCRKHHVYRVVCQSLIPLQLFTSFVVSSSTSLVPHFHSLGTCSSHELECVLGGGEVAW